MPARFQIETFGEAVGAVPAELQPDGTVIVRHLPFFSEIRESDPGVTEGERLPRNRAWLERAVQRHTARANGGRKPIMNLRHIFDDPERVGTYDLEPRLEQLAVNPGEDPRWTIFCTKVYESMDAFEKAKDHDARSPEISPDYPDEFGALALLRDKEPFAKYPNVVERLPESMREPFLAECYAAAAGISPQKWRAAPETFGVTGPTRMEIQKRGETFATSTNPPFWLIDTRTREKIDGPFQSGARAQAALAARAKSDAGVWDRLKIVSDEDYIEGIYSARPDSPRAVADAMLAKRTINRAEHAALVESFATTEQYGGPGSGPQPGSDKQGTFSKDAKGKTQFTPHPDAVKHIQAEREAMVRDKNEKNEASEGEVMADEKKDDIDARIEKSMAGFEERMVARFEERFSKLAGGEKKPEAAAAEPDGDPDAPKPEAAAAEPDEKDKKKPETATSRPPAGPLDGLPPAVSQAASFTHEEKLELFGLRSWARKQQQEEAVEAFISEGEAALKKDGVETTDDIRSELRESARTLGKAGVDRSVAIISRYAKNAARMPEPFGAAVGRADGAGVPESLKKAVEAFGAQPEAKRRIMELFGAWREQPEHFRRSTDFYRLCAGEPSINPACMEAFGGQRPDYASERKA